MTTNTERIDFVIVGGDMDGFIIDPSIFKKTNQFPLPPAGSKQQQYSKIVGEYPRIKQKVIQKVPRKDPYIALGSVFDMGFNFNIHEGTLEINKNKRNETK